MRCPFCNSTEIKEYSKKYLSENKEKCRRYYTCSSGHHFNTDGIEKDEWRFEIHNPKYSESLQKKKDYFENFDEFVKEKMEKGYTYQEIIQQISYVK